MSELQSHPENNNVRHKKRQKRKLFDLEVVHVLVPLDSCLSMVTVAETFVEPSP